MKIREAKKEDIKKLWKFEKENRNYDRKILGRKFKDFFLWDINNTEKRKWVKNIKKDLRKKNYIVLVAEENKELLGYTLGQIDRFKGSKKFQQIGHIWEFFVTKRARGRRISSKLINELIKWFKIKKIKYISLDVFAKNKDVIKIYEKFGFEQFSIHMKKELK